jgi:hypothetical protein
MIEGPDSVQMTIHADFVKILKNECPDAFSDSLMPQQSPDTVFIDGQVKLMKADDVKTWTVFLNVSQNGFCSCSSKQSSAASSKARGWSCFDDYC